MKVNINSLKNDVQPKLSNSSKSIKNFISIIESIKIPSDFSEAGKIVKIRNLAIDISKGIRLAQGSISECIIRILEAEKQNLQLSFLGAKLLGIQEDIKYESDYPEPEDSLEKGAKGEYVKWLQEALTKCGYNVGAIDGDYGNNTKKAIEKFQAENNLEVTGVFDPSYIQILKDSAIIKEKERIELKKQRTISTNVDNVSFYMECYTNQPKVEVLSKDGDSVITINLKNSVLFKSDRTIEIAGKKYCEVLYGYPRGCWIH